MCPALLGRRLALPYLSFAPYRNTVFLTRLPPSPRPPLLCPRSQGREQVGIAAQAQAGSDPRVDYIGAIHTDVRFFN